MPAFPRQRLAGQRQQIITPLFFCRLRLVFPPPPSIQSAWWQRAGLISKQKVAKWKFFYGDRRGLVALMDWGGGAQKTRCCVQGRSLVGFRGDAGVAG